MGSSRKPTTSTGCIYVGRLITQAACGWAVPSAGESCAGGDTVSTQAEDAWSPGWTELSTVSPTAQSWWPQQLSGAYTNSFCALQQSGREPALDERGMLEKGMACSVGVGGSNRGCSCMWSLLFPRSTGLCASQRYLTQIANLYKTVGC